MYDDPSSNSNNIIHVDCQLNPAGIQETDSCSNSSCSLTDISSAPHSSQSLSVDEITWNLKHDKDKWFIFDTKKRSHWWKCSGVPEQKINKQKTELFDKFF